MSDETGTDAGVPAQPTSDERLLAALAHGSVLLSFLGPIGPLLVWIGQRRKSAYVSFQALQAMTYQMAYFWIGMMGAMVIALFMSCMIVPLVMSMESDPSGSAFAPFLFQGGFFLLMFGILGLYFVGGIAGAVVSLLKKDFRYPILGRRLASFLGYLSAGDALDEEKEDRLVAATCHGSAILLMWGLVAPLIVWLTQKSRTAYLQFQSLQALAHQLMATVVYFGFMLVYFLGFGGMFLAIPLAGTLGGKSGDTVMGIAVLVFMVVILLIWGVFMLALPVYYIIALIATVQTLKGKDYRYPFIGKFIASRISDNPQES